ncbi:hypothetical protein GOFOIKOB_6212 [Methylobacterium tardum]|jgi:hypothetical protein|uniref:Secreted protein n=1 Tax=Methylobacterium tardum TaxID=374432 RepID=A0AA37THE3_9HYPH|nr:hypothetical protein [Methylobacterium tardum]URD39058.1 hypothetical protein M6G65_11965 [Methylobacterium tardum]GJE53136.1 hypothetical protein GOFOIKOB_6212 [Methylobacterium tardum]GLS68298.1 hypothetical protein GCM10007890_03100 [Methylobacterium tardum]
MTLRLVVTTVVLSLAVALPALPAAAQSPAQSFVYGQKRFRHACRPPLKFAAGACVRRCPGGYQDLGSYCRFRNQGFR